MFINILNELFRALPILASVISFILYFIINDLFIFYLFIGTLLSGILTTFLKDIIFLNIEKFLLYYNCYTIKNILGIFERPPGAKNCGSFYIDEFNFSKSRGMPSGHSILAGYISIYMYYYLINKYKIEKKKS